MSDLTSLFVQKRNIFVTEVAEAVGNKVAHVVGRTLCSVAEDYSSQNSHDPVAKSVPPLMKQMQSMMIEASSLQETDDMGAVANTIDQTDPFHRYLWTWAIGVGVASILCILAGLTSLSVMLIGILLAIALLALLPANHHVRQAWPLRMIAPKRSSELQLLDTQAKTDQAIRLADALESLCRNFDRTINILGDELDTETSPAPQPSQPAILMEFLQDLAEAATTSDAEQALRLAEKRTPAIATALGVEIIEYSQGRAACFLVDATPDASKMQTLCPAIVKGDLCLVKGYARGG
jgi:hypothetical protein